MAILCVNVDHVATVRQARQVRCPDPVMAAALAELAGARGITVHLREDRRHIQERDVRVLRETIQTKLNLEMAATDEMIKVALALRPDQVTLVPERRKELTTEGGLDVAGRSAELSPAVHVLQEEGILVSLFVDPEVAQLKAAHRLGVSCVEIHTGRYAEARDPVTQRAELEKIEAAAHFTARLGIRVFAGHGLDYLNVDPIAALPEVEELNIGHSIIARAVLVGMERAVREMIAAMGEGES